MTNPEARSLLLTDQLQRVRAAWPGGPWEWDGRFGCALSTVGTEHQAVARAALLAGLPESWTEATLTQAPAAIQGVCAAVGGLRGTQLVFAALLGDGAFAYCLWWPWGSGANVSARIGATEPKQLNPVVRSTLGIR
jgi:hypothetical protein